MDVRCERCRAQYVFDDEQVTPQGLTVQCTNCGHVFRVKKKELVVTVPVRPEDVTEQPLLATAVAPRPPGEAPRAGWTIRQRGGGTLAFTELTTLQKWIVERKVSRDDEVTQGDDAWVKLGSIGELGSFFEVVEAAERGRRPPVVHAGSTDFYPPPPFPPPGFPPPAVAPPAPAPAPAARPRPPAAAEAPALTTELDPEELAAVRGRKGSRSRLVVTALLAVSLAAVAYVFGPALLGREPPVPPPHAAPPPAAAPAPAAPPAAAPAPPPTVAVPLDIQLEDPAPAPPPEPAPDKAPPPVARAPEPAAEAAPPKAPGAKALLAQAAKVRAAGEAAKALDLFGKVLATQPDNVEALTGRGLCYFELGQYAPAETSFKRALQLDLEYPDAIMGLAETYRQQGRKAEALGLFERYLAVHPDGEEAAVARYAISQLKE